MRDRLIPPAEFEAIYDITRAPRAWWPSPMNPSLYETQSGSPTATVGYVAAGVGFRSRTDMLYERSP